MSEYIILMSGGAAIRGGLWLSIELKFFQFRYFPYTVSQTFGKIFTKPEGEGTGTPFQSVTAALASTVGASNIIGVPIGRVTEKLVPFMSILYLLGAIVIIISNIDKVPAAFGLIFSRAFRPAAAVGGFGVVTFSLLAFVISTIIVIIFYGEKQAEYLFGTAFSKKWIYVYIVSIVVGAVDAAEILWHFLDILLAGIIIPNLIAIILLRKEVVELTKEFFTSDKYYLKDIRK